MHGENAFFVARKAKHKSSLLAPFASLFCPDTRYSFSLFLFIFFSQPLLCIANTNIWGRDTFDVFQQCLDAGNFSPASRFCFPSLGQVK